MSSSIHTKTSQATPAPTSPAVPAVYSGETPLEGLFRELRSGKGARRNLAGTNLGNALESVVANRVRSFLTVLGIVIGVAAVIGAITLAQGVGLFFSNAIGGLGSNTILLSGYPSVLQQRGAPSPTKRTHPSLTPSDLQYLSRLPHVIAASPVLSTNMQVVYGNQNWRTGIIGTNTDLQTIQSWQVAQGLWFSSTQDSGAQPVAVLGDTAVKNLFGNTGINPIGQQIRVGTQTFRVVGVLAPKGASGFGASDSSIFVPFRAFQTRFTNSTYLGQINLEADDQSSVNLVVQELTTGLELQHHIPRGTPDDFATNTAGQLLQQANIATQAIATLLGGIAAISLTVGGIGIINIMLVSVTERTREIGIRMAIGARRGDIRNQFLIEALVLCLAGGFIGMLLGILIGWLMVGVLISAVASGGGGSSVPVVITPTTLILPFAVSAAVGLIFGLYPALRASRLDPIAAIRRAR
ncbi:MAG TPA: ABC transporter permease [Ktedonobacteraceae bacterium]